MMLISRRRMIAVTAAALGFGRGGKALATPPVEWRGVALGAPARLILRHPDRDQALRLLDAALAEIERMERVFSLYRPDSALSRLNQRGRLEAPPGDLVVCLSQALRIAELSQGAFDPTVQPLWALHARHFAQPDADPAGPSEPLVRAARALVDWRRVSLDPRMIRLEPGMAVTLNGIAQGHASDRVANLLRQAGMGAVLVHLGETRAAGPPTGDSWRIGLPDGRVVDLTGDAAIATSSPDGTRFSPACHHLFDPRTGRSAKAVAVTVQAPSAALADGLSTALSVGAGRDLLDAFPATRTP
ncbi:MAG: FAD:protein FMN transferase [Alphaproteobacteria bacterium]|nr:FAD:protein FMN transferase [Alphaproteobacteria bacterium]